MLTGMIVIAAGIAAASVLVKPSKARSFDLFYGSVLINDNTSPVAIDLASGKPTVRLSNAWTSVSAKRTADLNVVPLSGANTLMLNPTSGEFNMVDSTGFVVKTTGGGVQLPKTEEATTSRAVPAGSSAYILRSGQGASSIYLVGQPTVAWAIGTKAKARAYAALDAPVADLPSPAASANGELWVLTGTEKPYSVTQLRVPTGSNAGVTLLAQKYGNVNGMAAIGAATLNADGTGGDVAALAAPDSVRVFAGSVASTLPVRIAGTVDAIRAATNAQGQLVFLYHSTSSGWSRVSASTSGIGVARVTELDAIDPGARLVTPAAGDGQLYTMDTLGSGDLWQIDPNGTAHVVAGAEHYPTVAIEHGDLSQAEVVARGSRVIFNARANYRAQVVFSDGSHAPRIIDKHSAVQVDPSGAGALADALTRDKPPKPGKKPPPAPPKTAAPRPPAQPINNKAACRSTTQNPHIPAVQLLERGSRSVSLQWAYPLLDPSDCAPSTYTVTTKVLSPDAPPAPSVVAVQGQNGVTLTGLFPDTEYRLVVTAYLNGLGTSSRPLTVRTDVEGPAAPTQVRTRVDDAGNWTVSWTSCGGVQTGCVPVADWQIIPRLCDGQSLSSAPALQHLSGDPTQHSWQWSYQGNDALLGRGLSFTIEGVGTKGTVGTPAGDNACSYSWTNPVPGDISVAASAPAQTSASQATTDITVSVRFARGQIHDLGGVGGQLSYELVSGGTVVSRSGPTTKATATLDGITAGNKYQVIVRATPPRHPENGVTVTTAVTPAVAAWPPPSIEVSFGNTTATSGTLAVTVGFGGADTRGETFDLGDSALTCGSSQVTLTGSNVRPGVTLRFPEIDRTNFNGTCTVSVQLVQNASTATRPPLYGAGPSARVTTGVTIAPPSVTANAGDFSANFSANAQRGQPEIVVSYRGTDDLIFASNWVIIANNGLRDCGSSRQQPTVTFDVDASCVSRATKWTVRISYRYFLSNPSYGVDVGGPAPAPVDPDKITFDPGTWDLKKPEAIAHYTGSYDQATLNTLSWTETVTSNGIECGSNDAVPTDDGVGPHIIVDLTLCPPFLPGVGTDPPTPNTYTLTITYSDPFGGSNTYSLAITGSPPE